MTGPTEADDWPADDRERAREAALEVWIEEELGAVEAPDLVSAVWARLDASGARSIQSAAGVRRKPWLWAAMLFAGVATVVGTLWLERREHDRERGSQQAADPAVTPQDPEPVRPATLEEFRWFLSYAERLRIRSYTSGKIILDGFGAGQPFEVALRDEDKAWLRRVAPTARLDPPLPAFGNHMDLIASDGRFARVVLLQNPIRMASAHLGHIVLAGGQDCPLRWHLADAERQARYAQARLDIGDLHQFNPWRPADDWDGRLAVSNAGADFVEHLDSYDWADRLRALDLRDSGSTLQNVSLPVPPVPKLRELRWPGTVDARALRALANLSELRVLQPGTPQPVILGTPTNSETRALAAALLERAAAASLKELDLTGAPWLDIWFGDVEPSAGTPPATPFGLRISGTQLGARFLTAMAARGRHPSALWAERSSVDDAALAALGSAADAGALHTLDVSHCLGVTSAGLSALLGRARLRELRLVAMACDLPTLKRVPATQPDLVSLALGWDPGVSGGTIDDELVGAIARLPRLEVLSLRGRAGWTDAGLAALAKAPALRELDVIHCPGITVSGIAALRRDRPALVVGSDQDR